MSTRSPRSPMATGCGRAGLGVQMARCAGVGRILGGFVCPVHGGAAPKVRAKANARLESASIYPGVGVLSAARCGRGTVSGMARLIQAQIRPVPPLASDPRVTA
jgi:hypothetical protein